MLPHLLHLRFQAGYPCLSLSFTSAAHRIASGIADSCVFPRKEVYTTAATVCGLALAAMEGGEEEEGGGDEGMGGGQGATNTTSSLRYGRVVGSNLLGSQSAVCAEALGLAKAVHDRLKTLGSGSGGGGGGSFFKEMPHKISVIVNVSQLYPRFFGRDTALKLLTVFPSLKSKERAMVLKGLVLMPLAYRPCDPTLFEHLRPVLPELLMDATEFNENPSVPSRPKWRPSVQLNTLAFLHQHALNIGNEVRGGNIPDWWWWGGGDCV